MKRYFILIVFASTLLSGCGFDNNQPPNQFTLKNHILFFNKHKLGEWKTQNFPYCLQCSFNIESKRSPQGPIIFKQINNPRGELVFFSAKNMHSSFALQTGNAQHSIRANLDKRSLQLAIDQGDLFTLPLNKVLTQSIDNINYKFRLSELTIKKQGYHADIFIWKID